jgi:hypothetical protein
MMDDSERKRWFMVLKMDRCNSPPTRLNHPPPHPPPTPAQSEKFAFDWFFKSRTAVELQKRGDTLIKLLEREKADVGGGGGGGGASRVRLFWCFCFCSSHVCVCVFVCLFVFSHVCVFGACPVLLLSPTLIVATRVLPTRFVDLCRAAAPASASGLGRRAARAGRMRRRTRRTRRTRRRVGRRRRAALRAGRRQRPTMREGDFVSRKCVISSGAM